MAAHCFGCGGVGWGGVRGGAIYARRLSVDGQMCPTTAISWSASIQFQKTLQNAQGLSEEEQWEQF